MSKQKGNICLRLTDTPSGVAGSIVYRGPQGRRTMKNLGVVDMTTPEGKQKCADALEAILTPLREARQASR